MKKHNKRNCYFENGKLICLPKSSKITFNFLTPDSNQYQVLKVNLEQQNAKKYLNEFVKRALKTETTAEGRQIYQMLEHAVNNLDLNKTSNKQQLLDFAKIGTDICQIINCNTTTEMSLIAHDLLSIFNDKNLVPPRHKANLNEATKFLNTIFKSKLSNQPKSRNKIL